MKISYSLSRTLNLHGNEFVKVEISVEDECEREDLEKRFKEVRQFVKDRITKEEISWKV